MLTKLKKNKKGFTLAELLIVVAIIAVLVAIAIPTFTNALASARQATDDANIRAAFAQYTVNQMLASVDPGQASAADAKAAFDDMGVTELVYYTKVTIPLNGSRWVGDDTATASSTPIAESVFVPET